MWSDLEEESAQQEALRIRYKNSLYDTCKYLLGYKDMTKRTHGDMIDALESNTQRKLIIMPRGTFKSSVGVVGYSIWRLIRNPNERILIDSELYTNSKNFIREMRAHMASEEFIELFGDWEGDQWSEGEITVNCRTKSFPQASVTAGGVGTTKVGQHFSIIIGDDMNSRNNSETPENRQKVVKHYQMNQAILEPDGTYVLIGTRYAVDDVYGHVIENELGLKTDPIGITEYEPDRDWET